MKKNVFGLMIKKEVKYVFDWENPLKQSNAYTMILDMCAMMQAILICENMDGE